MFWWSALAGAFAAGGSALGKLSGATFAAWGGARGAGACAALLGCMVAANTCGCRYYVRALDASHNSLVPTVVSAAVNYILSGVAGIALFGEWWSWRWWLGAVLVSLGLAVLAPQPASSSLNKKEHSA